MALYRKFGLKTKISCALLYSMVESSLLLLGCCFLLLNSLWADDYSQYFFDAQSLGGPTGYIENPSAKGEKIFNCLTGFGLSAGIWFSNRLAVGSYFFSLTKSVNYSMFIVDYDTSSKHYNFGWRSVLSPKIKLDIYFNDLKNSGSFFNSFVFGLSFSG